MIVEKSDIQKFLPHRPPFVFVDSIRSYSRGRSIVGALFLNEDRDFFKGHFPNNPIMPGVLIVESLAQTCGLLIALDSFCEAGGDISELKNCEPTQGAKKLFYLASNNVKFTSPARAGDELELNCNLVKSFGKLWQFSVEALCGRVKIAGGTLVLAQSE